ncbi:MAG: hypothetical protein IPM82_19745 [Saprospiraceae bacterium]|nr:hypothetical protein [Saprospiraceae bacterium]
MKRLISRCLLLTILAFLANVTATAQTKKASVANINNRVEVLDFHTDHRCATCLEIEKLTKKVLADHYANEMKSGKITFRLLNADDKANAAIVEKFMAYGTTLIVYSVKSGKENHVDLTSFAFMNFNKADKFTAELRKEVDAALKKIQP